MDPQAVGADLLVRNRGCTRPGPAVRNFSTSPWRKGGSRPWRRPARGGYRVTASTWTPMAGLSRRRSWIPTSTSTPFSPWGSLGTTNREPSSRASSPGPNKRRRWPEDVKARAREAIRWEVAHGTGVIRSHVDVCDPSLVALQALIELRGEVRDIVDLELIALPRMAFCRSPKARS